VYGAVGRQYHRIVEVVAIRSVADNIVIIASVAECSIAADSVAKYRSERVVDVQTNFNVTVATVYSAVGGKYHRVVETFAVRGVVDNIVIVASVAECSIAADGVAKYRSERVVDVQMYLKYTVATCVQSNAVVQHRIADKSRWRTYYTVFVIYIATADGIVIDVAEGVVDMQTYHQKTVATLNCGHKIVKHCVVDKSRRNTYYTVITINFATTDSIAIDVAEGVVHCQVDIQ